MKKRFFTFILATIAIYHVYSQSGASINSTGTPADPSAALDVSSNSQGLLIPRMTTAERNNISSPAQSLLIYNTSTSCLEIYIYTTWQTIFCGCNMPATPSSGTHSTTQNSILWKWNSVTGATGYKYNTANDYTSAIDNNTDTSFNQTGLNCSSGYTLYVWAYNSCGHSASATLSQNTSICFTCGINSVTFNYKGSSVTYNTVSGQNSTCWLDRNLGALQVANASNDANAYGDWFQWGRADDGHQDINSGTTSVLSTTYNPGHSLFITCSVSPYDWLSPQNDNLWQGVSGTNNPCPSGWRLPINVELENERLSWSANNSTGAFASNLKWATNGIRWIDDGIIQNSGTHGYHWSSTIDGTNSRYLFCYGSSASVGTRARAAGMAVRCIKD